jgi:hypothetical protein
MFWGASSLVERPAVVGEGEAADSGGMAAQEPTTTDSRSQRTRASRRGGHPLTRAHGSSNAPACPFCISPDAPVPDGRTVLPGCATPPGRPDGRESTGRLRLSYRYHPDRVDVLDGAAPNPGHQGRRLPSGWTGDGVQAHRVRPAAVASSEWPAPRGARPRRRHLREGRAYRATQLAGSESRRVISGSSRSTGLDDSSCPHVGNA